MEAHKDNLSRDNLRPLVVLLLPISGSPLVTQDNLMLNKVNQVSSKATILGKLVSLMLNKANQVSSKATLLGKLVRRMFSKANPLPSLVNQLDRVVNLKIN